MMTTNILFSLITFSGLGMIFIFGRRLIEARKLEKEELSRRINPHQLSFKSLSVAFLRFLKNLFKNIFIPFLYRVIERIIFNLGLFVKKIEKSLLKLDNYIRGKYKLIKKSNNGNGSKYWEDIIDFKNDLDENGDKPE